MPTNYPTWNTYHGHGEPATGFYWGDDPRGPQQGDGFGYEYRVMEQGRLLVIQGRQGHRVTFGHEKWFWWSSERPSQFWWDERNALRRRAIADRHEMLAIESGRHHPAFGDFKPGPITPMPTRELPEIGHHRRLAAERARTMPINHDAFRHPLQGKPKGQDSEYAWLLDAQLHARACGDGTSVMACDWHYQRSAMLTIQPFNIPHGPTVHVITVNGHIFQWEMDSRFIMHIITSAQNTKGRHETSVFKEDAGAQPAPGQAEDNVVVPLNCGHELDLPFDPGPNTDFYCGRCDMMVDRADRPGGTNPYPEPRPSNEFPHRLSCSHIRMLGKRQQRGEEVRCYECAPGNGVLRSVI